MKTQRTTSKELILILILILIFPIVGMISYYLQNL
jgi:hypothetical protein